MFPDPEIAKRMEKFVLVRLWNNDPKPEAQSARWKRMLEERFHTSGIPLYVVLSKDDAVLGTLAFPGGTPAAFVTKMSAWLDEMLAKSAPK